MKEMLLFLKKYKKRINKVLKGGRVFAILSSILLSSLVPPLDIYADTITQANIIGTNVWTEPVSSEYISGTSNNVVSNTAIVNIEIELDQSYLGWINLGISVKIKNYYYAANPPYWGDTTVPFSGNYYVNGSTVLIKVPISWNSQQLGYQMGSPTHLPNSSSDITLSLSNQGNVTPIGDLSTLQDILLVLEDIQNNVEIDVIKELQNIQKLKQWHFPIESFAFVSYAFKNYEYHDYYSLNYWDFPVFTIKKNKYLIHAPLSASDTVFADYIFYLNRYIYNGSNSLEQYFNWNHNLTVEFKQLYQSYYPDNVGYVYHIRFKNKTTSSQAVNFQYINDNDSLIIPIYYGNHNNYKYISTDFALNFGLSNSLLDDLHNISQGTNQSNQSSSNLETQKDSFNTTSNDLYTSENAFNTDMNNKLNNIDTSFDPTNAFGSKFLQSADWVRIQFGNLTNSSPFGTVLSFSMLLGLSLLIIGKVFK